MKILFASKQEPKTLELQKTDDNRLRLLITLNKLGVKNMLEYFLKQDEAQALSQALQQ